MNLRKDGRWKFLILIYYISNKSILISKSKKVLYCLLLLNLKWILSIYTGLGFRPVIQDKWESVPEWSYVERLLGPQNQFWASSGN